MRTMQIPELWIWERVKWSEKHVMDLNLKIPQEISKMMKERFILFEDVEKVIANSRKTGQRFFNLEDSSYLASLRIDNVTYWVRYTEKEDGIQVISIYSHRMEVVKE